MKPRDTSYRLASDSSDYARCHALMKSLGLGRERLGWPTVMAIRDGKVIGFFSTHRKKTTLMAGPLVIDPKVGTIFTALRLVEAYELVLSQAGVKYYWFTIGTEGMEKAVNHLMERYGGLVKEIARSEGAPALYRRDLVAA